MKHSIFLVGSLILTAASAWAAPAASDPLQMSIDEAERSVQARIRDWQDDAATFTKKRNVMCALAGLEAGTLPGVLGDLPSVTALANLPRAIGDSGRPLQESLSQVAQEAPLNDGERGEIEALMARSAPTLADQIRLFIDTESFLIRVSDRLFNEAIEAHLAQTRGWTNTLRVPLETCEASTLRVERDDRLGRAAQLILAYYESLKQELSRQSAQAPL